MPKFTAGEEGPVEPDGWHPSVEDMSLGRVLSAVADDLRRGVVLEMLAEPPGTERSGASFSLPVSKSTCTHHFRVLREAGLLRVIDYGNRRGVTLRREDLDARFPGLLLLLRSEQQLLSATGRDGVSH